ncbi:uncharacterized protein LOC107861158 [Capsicum annuum]|uniref:uncharacterized protein LOC107861158 n=1 Tax=Capsicum annuum TaxID=4072 RepID=UPI001FB0E0B6|nr:uncharacterized protein LOC107861158 [Capsicum annuum]
MGTWKPSSNLACTYSQSAPNWLMDSGIQHHLRSDLDNLAIQLEYHGLEEVTLETVFPFAAQDDAMVPATSINVAQLTVQTPSSLSQPIVPISFLLNSSSPSPATASTALRDNSSSTLQCML